MTAAFASAALSGLAILAAGFMLSRGADVAGKHLAGGLALALLALVAALPVFMLEFHYAARAGHHLASGHAHLVGANMTGAIRLLVGIGWPLIVLLHWWRNRRSTVQMNSTDVAGILFLLWPALYSFFLSSKQRIDPLDGFVLLAIHCLYLWRLSWPRMPGNGKHRKMRERISAATAGMRHMAMEYPATVALSLVAVAVVMMEAKTFAESLPTVAGELGINRYSLVQSLSPLVALAPALVLAAVFALRSRPGHALGMLANILIGLWTLLPGALPLLYALDAGRWTSLPLDPRQGAELFLAAAQTLFAVMLLVRLRITPVSALILFALFLAQIAAAFLPNGDDAHAMRLPMLLGWICVALACGLAALNGRRFIRAVNAGLGRVSARANAHASP